MSIMGFTDIHCHIIPSVDDGAEDMGMAQEMLRIAYEADTRCIIATPHYGTRRAREGSVISGLQFRELNEWAERHYPDMKLYLGQELSYYHGLEEKLKQGSVFTMAGSHYALIEFQPEDDFSRIRQGLEAIRMAGYWPILAHAERCRKLAQNVNYIEELVDRGVRIQVNVQSVLGGNGWHCKSLTKKLLKRRLIHFVASDGHNTKKRIPSIQSGMQYIASRYGRDYALELAVENPAKIIEDRFID